MAQLSKTEEELTRVNRGSAINSSRSDAPAMSVDLLSSSGGAGSRVTAQDFEALRHETLTLKASVEKVIFFLRFL